MFTGNKLELTCRAEAAPGMTVDYIWFKCLKKDGTHKKPTNFLGYRMIIPVCDENTEGYYLCEAYATKTYKCDSINSDVARVKVVNSTNILITKQPTSQVYITLGETLILECKASCKTHLVKYQWYNGV